MKRALHVSLCALVTCLTAAEPREPDSPSDQVIDGKETARKKKKKAEEPSGWYTGFKNRPRAGYGDAFLVEFRFKTQADFSFVGDDADDDDDVDTLAFRRTRVGFEGTFLRDFEYEVDAEVGETRAMLRDAYVNYRRLRPVQIQIGHFRVPFGRDQNTASHNLDFVFRSRPGTLLAPGRDVGLMLHSRVWGRRLHYQAGVFRRDGAMPLDLEGRAGGDLTWAARLRNKPSSVAPLPKVIKDLEVGVAIAHSSLPEGLFALRGRTTFRETFFPRVYVNGNRLRTGLEMEWKLGPFGVQGELLRTRDQRRGQSVRGDDLPDLLAQGWYLQGTWVLTGEKKDGGVEPRKNFLVDRGWGAVELAVRQEYLGFRSVDRSGPALTSLRAANLASAADRVWTFGVNWYTSRYIKLQINAIRERVDEPGRAPPGLPRAVFWTQVCRLQVVI